MKNPWAPAAACAASSMAQESSGENMDRSKPRALATGRSWWLLPLLLYLAAIAPAGLLQARAQPDSNGFITLDCGLPGPSYVDGTTNLTYHPDDAFTDAGEKHNISQTEYKMLFGSLRSFPDGKRNCYTLRSLTAGNKYLIRANFMYGNYDGLNKPPDFDLYIGVNFWQTVDGWTQERAALTWEAIVTVPDNFVQVCLVKTSDTTPFISGLELRPLKSSMYPQVNATQGLSFLRRYNLGVTDNYVRYPDDPYDRVWFPQKIDETTVISTDKMVQNSDKDEFEVPSKVMQTAINSHNASDNIILGWSLTPDPPPPGCIFILYFSEIEPLPDKAVRQFYTKINDEVGQDYTPRYLQSGAIFNKNPQRGNGQYTATIKATASSTLPPIINAYELFFVISTAKFGTESQDVSAITAIKIKYRVTKNWTGDPCDSFTWTGLRCRSAISARPRITSVNMSFSSLNGDISPTFANLTAVQYINLSYNNLTGTIPDVLSQLPSLTTLDLTGNNLSGSIPPGLRKKIQDGVLKIKYDNNPNLCTHGDSCTTTKEKSRLGIYIAVPVAVTLLVVSVIVLVFLLKRKRKDDAHSSLQLQNRRFTYKELEMATKNFRNVIGQGGFGKVYHGSLEDDTQVAVKMPSKSSPKQVMEQFLMEAQILTRIHHKNLISLIGYCKDEKHVALVYEYMSKGNLEDHIKEQNLTWRQRVQIVLEAAQGLEYLHKGCNPPLIHRDVKTANILLNEKLEAKVADFGISKAFNLDKCSTYVSTENVVGTRGYLDPEYHATMRLTRKSDVFSFGVVLLELITGKPAILPAPDFISIIQWTSRRLRCGEIESVVDERMNGDHDINSIWKAANVARDCTAPTSTERPTMTDVVAQLQECLVLEEARAGVDTTQSFHTGNSGDLNSNYSTNANTANASQRSAAFEMVEMMDTGPATR